MSNESFPTIITFVRDLTKDAPTAFVGPIISLLISHTISIMEGSTHFSMRLCTIKFKKKIFLTSYEWTASCPRRHIRGCGKHHLWYDAIKEKPLGYLD